MLYTDACFCRSREKLSFRVRTETETQTKDVWTRRKDGREKGRVG